MNKLDLHNTRHQDVSKLIDKFLWDNHDRYPLQIVTGNSQEMKDVVISVLDEYGHNYQIGDFFGINTGFIQINS